MKYVIFIPDGSSDYPIDELDGMTPLMAADTPNIDKMAKSAKFFSLPGTRQHATSVPG